MFYGAAWAQMDNVVEVENDFKPIVKDANKINSLPEIEQPSSRHFNVDYTTQPVPSQEFVFQPLWAARNNQLIRGDKKGFFSAAYGFDNQVMGRLAYGFDISDVDLLNLEFSTNGHNSKTDNLIDNSKWNNRFFRNQLLAGYEHQFDNLSMLTVNASYISEVFNYQTPKTALFSDKQHNDLVDFKAELTPYSFDKFAIAGEINFSLFQQKAIFIGGALSDKPKETYMNVEITPSYQINENWGVDLQMSVENTIYGMNGYDHVTSFDFTPHVTLTSDDVELSAGVYVDDDFNIAPDVELIYHAQSPYDLYLTATGGQVLNNFRHFSQMTPYWALNPNQKFANQFDQLRAHGGIRLKPSESFYADLSVGYDISKDRAELADFLQNYRYISLIFADGSHFYANANLQYIYKDIVSAQLEGQYNVWSTDFKPNYTGVNITNWDKILWRPQWDVKAKINVKPVKEFCIEANMLFQTFKKMSNRYERPNTLNLGASLSYTFPCRLTIFAKGDNLLNRKYDLYTAYRSSGISCLGGLAFTF